MDMAPIIFLDIDGVMIAYEISSSSMRTLHAGSVSGMREGR